MNIIEQYLVDKGYDLDHLLCDKKVYKVTNLANAAKLIREAAEKGIHIHLTADYDCDGIMAGCEMYLIFTELGANFTIRFPRKMSEGYGISDKIVNEIPDGSLVVTIDNGIAAVEAIDKVIGRGMDVVILDHHEIRGDGIVPNATVVVDPHIYKEEDEFEHYCGAGIAYKLAKELNLSQETIKKCNVLAAIATIQDVVPLVDDNRNIVKEGLKLLNSQAVNLPGIYSLCSALNLMPVSNSPASINEEDIAFQIGPCVNAMGRMLDDGAELAYKNLMHYGEYKDGEDGIREILEWNKKRKEETTRQQNMLEIEAQTAITKKTTCAVLYLEGLHEGIIGINAARVCENHNMPAIILTDSEEEGILKGSARSVEGINMKLALDAASEYIYKYGGHAGAAGLSVEKSKLADFIEAINKVIPRASVNNNTWKYDLEITEPEIPAVYKALRKYAPYGEAFRAPVIRVNDYVLAKNYGKYYKYIGEAGVSFNGMNSEAVTFTLKEKYRELGTPLTMNIVGTLGYSRRNERAQVMVNDFQPVIKQQEVGFLL